MKKLCFMLVSLLVSVSALYAQTPDEMFEKGKAAYLVKNYTEAITWYRKAAEQGHAAAQNNLGVCYYNGHGVPQDDIQAVVWYRKAAEQGQVKAQNNLGICYEDGRGVSQDYVQAVAWYRKAAAQGNAAAQRNLGYCYEKGQGVSQDDIQAAIWLCKAMEQGDKMAQMKLELKPQYLETKKILDSPFSAYAKPYVEQRINEWQKKGEFEKISDWQVRVNETSRKEKIAELTKEAEREFLAEKSKVLPINLLLGDYDSENEVFMIQDARFGNLLVPVPIAEASRFKAGWNSIRITPQYGIADDELILAEIAFSIPSGKEYKYSNQASLNYSVAQVEYNFDPIDIAVANTSTPPKGNQTISQTKVSIGKSDVDTNIPQSATINDKTFAVIIANENYQRESEVEFANNDGETLRTYCVKTLGMPEANVHYVADATLNNMRAEIDWITKVAAAYNGQANILFYYAGHGIPDEGTRAVYLLPVDGYGSNVITGYKLSDLYAKLADCGAKSAVVFLDACFSGAQRSGEMLASARGVAIKAKPETPLGNMVIFSAAQGDETAYPYREKGHGMFTYFLLKKLQATQGSATLGELNDYIVENVSQRSIVTNSKSQTPTVTSAGALLDGWKTIRLR